jgi:hypothetical protein
VNYQEVLARLQHEVNSELEAAQNRAGQAESRAALLDAQCEELRDTGVLVAQGQQVLTDLTAWKQVASCAVAQTAAENDLRITKATDLPRAKERLDEAEADATMGAYADGAVDGKNAEQRKTQLDAYLVSNEAVRAAREHLRAVETRVVNLEAALAVAETEHKAALARWNTARAQAELLAAMLTAVAAG